MSLSCLKCNKPLIKDQKKYCSRSCAAKVNNIGIVRNGKSLIKKKCEYCETITTNPKYCSEKCTHEHRTAKLFSLMEQGLKDYSKKYLLHYYGHQCQKCKLTKWNDQPIPIEIEHIDGNSNNNTFDNLTLLCPNCHAQTPTYKGANKGNGRHFRRIRYANGQSY